MQRLSCHREKGGPIPYTIQVNQHNEQDQEWGFDEHELVVFLDNMDHLERVRVVTPDGGTHYLRFAE